MLLCLALWALASQSQTFTVTLHRGARLETDTETRYWSAEDTVLDSEYPLRSYGQAANLPLAAGKRMLIRFGDLERALGPNAKVTKAALILELEHLQAPGEIRLHRFRARWNEGAGSGTAQPEPPQWSTSWEYQFFSSKGSLRKWKRGGEDFVEPKSSSRAQVSKDQEQVVLSGLEADVQHFYERWYENNGWAIEFTGICTLSSSQSPVGRPRLLIEYVRVDEKTGADLSVICIERTPEYERYDNRGDAYVTKEVGGHKAGVMMNPGGADTKKWPKDGEEVTYTAIVKNVGTSAANGFDFEWSKDFEPAIRGSSRESLSPGQSMRLTYKTQFKNEHFDHRTQPISFKLKPAGHDASTANDYLEIQANALNIGIWVDEGFYKLIGKQVNAIGTRSFEDWIQWQFRIWNDVFLAHSRFSIAPDGCKERVRVGRITIVPNGTLKGGAHIPNDTPTLIYDGEWGFDSSFGEPAKYADAVRQKADRALLHELSHQIGLIDLYWMNVDPSLPNGEGGKVKLFYADGVVTRGMLDPYPGLMGGGDTRNDAQIPMQLTLPQEPVSEVVFIGPLFEETDLYSFTDVAGLETNLGYRRGFYGEFMYSLPQECLIIATDMWGNQIREGTLSFYQMKNGAILDGQPDFVVNITAGSALLPKRPTGLDAPFTTVTGHTLRPNPFGRIDVVGTNGVFLVRLDYQGQTEWAWVKLWQLVDAYYRGNVSAFLLNLKFNVTSHPVAPPDLALGRMVKDKSGSPMTETKKLVDADPRSFYELGTEQGDWFEIDIGRDRPIGEVRVVVAGDHNAFWQRFDIVVYSTGQQVSDARIYARELDWRRAVSLKRDVDLQNYDIKSVAYRAKPQTVRFIRFVNKSGGGGRVAAVEVREVVTGR